MYAGTNGEKLEAQIFIGIVYYQRLRHMVSDKSQVRATGPTNSLTRQPVQGRKKNGGAYSYIQVALSNVVELPSVHLLSSPSFFSSFSSPFPLANYFTNSFQLRM
tara:strand:- start:153 stop:467 length:315 start_codon:yes stop_codon:yes gene_type:complete